MRLTHHWGRRIKHLRRYRHITAVLVRHGFGEISQGLSYRLHLRRNHEEFRVAPGETRPQRLRVVLEELGPTFVKFGQLLSTRPDLLPPAYIEELEKLQDRVAPVSFDAVRGEIEQQLHRPLEDIFSNFEPQPLASASIAQVHRALTREGQQVAVKVRRPGIVQALQTECEILEGFASLVRSSLPPGETIDPVRMVREFTDAVTREADFINELRNIQKFRTNFAGDAAIRICRPFEDYSASGVLTMEFIDGIKPTSAADLREAGLDPKLIAHRGADFVLRQVFDFGLFHTDPHPGNFLVLPNNVLAPLDFGQVARLTSSDRFLLGELVLAIVDTDAERMIRAFRRAGLISYQTNIPAVTGELEEILESYHSLPFAQVALGRMMLQSFDLIRRHHIHPPPEFTMMLKSMMTIESLGVRLDRDFSILELLRPYAQRLSFEQVSPSRLLRQTRRSLREMLDLSANLPEDIGNILHKVQDGQFQMRVHHEHLESMIHTLGKGSNRISLAFIIAGLVVASSLLVTQEHGTVLGLMRLQTLGTLGYLIAAFMGLWLAASIIRSRHL